MILWYYVVQHKSKPPDSENLCAQGLKGKTTNGKTGAMQTCCCSSGTVSPTCFDNLPQELGLDPVWFTSVRWTVLSHTWTSLKGLGASDTMTYYVNFCHEFIYDLTYDSCIKALVKIQQASK